MQKLYEGQLNHIWFPIVDSSDGLSIESAIDASDIKVSLFGFLKGNSAVASRVASGTGSLAASGRDFYEVRPGVYGVRIGTAELSDTQNAFYDKYLLWASVTGGALVLMEIEGEYKDLSEVYELISDADSQLLLNASVLSDIDSQVLLNASVISDAHSAAILAASHASDALSLAQDIDSQLLVTQSLVSDIDSQILLNASMISDLDSQLTVTHSLLSDVESQVDLLATSDYLSDVHSDLKSAIAAGGGGATPSAIADKVWSDFASKAGPSISNFVSDVSHMLSGISGLLSDVDSQILVTASLVSDVESQVDLIGNKSDIASAVWGEKHRVHSLASSFGSAFSNLWTEAENAASRALLSQSLISDVDSQLTLTASLVSDIDSQLAVTHDLLSDVESQVDLLATSDYLSGVHSDLRSQISGITASVGSSDISDIASAVQAIQSSRMSDILSAAQQANSRALVVQSMVSDVDSQLLVTASLVSDIDSQVLLNASLLSDVDSQLNLLGDKSDIASAVWSEKYSDQSVASSFGSAFSAMWTEAENAASRALLNQSLISDVDSQLLVTASLVSDIDSQLTATQSLLSDVESQVDLLATSDYLSDVHSDLRSQISGITASIGASDISDIASAVQAIQASRLSDILSAAQQTNSRTMAVQSMVSDVDSQLAATHDLVSDVDSQLNLNASVLSDVQSQLDATHDLVSDIESQLDVTHSLVSDIESQIDLTASVISDVQSAVALIASDLPAHPAKGVALSNLQILMVDSSGDPAAGLTVTVQISKDGGAFGNITGSVTEISDGAYHFDLTAAEMNADTIMLKATAPGAKNRYITIVTQPT